MKEEETQVDLERSATEVVNVVVLLICLGAERPNKVTSYVGLTLISI